jgi:nucleoid-associated protein YgaU
MGLYKFLKNAGASLVGADEKKDEDIRKHILELLEKQGNQLENLTVACDEGTVTLSGTCDTVKTKEKAILIAGNIEGIEQVDGDGLVVPQAQKAAPAAPVESTPAEPQASAASGSRVVPQPQAAAPATPVESTPAEPQAPTAPAAPTPSPESPAETQPAEESQFYTIQKGDTLSGIAKKFYGKAGKYMYIFEENTGVIEDPDKIYPGQTIRIPPLK